MIWIIISFVEYLILGRVLYKIGTKDKELPCPKYIWAVICILWVLFIPISFILKLLDPNKSLLNTLDRIARNH